MPEPNINRLIVIGASAGGIEALLNVMPQLPADLPASICVVVHTAARAKSLLPKLLTRAGHMPAKYGEDGETLKTGKVYVAPPDHHIMIQGNQIKLSQGPRENLSRPAIDPLFRTAAAAFDGAVIGVILSGMLDDGTHGLLAIKSGGGTTIVQDPDDCSFSGMPHNAIENVQIDYVLKAGDIGRRLIELCNDAKAKPINRQSPDNQMHGVDGFMCPECGGVLREDSSPMLHFVCHVGHTVSGETLLAAQSQSVEKALWSAIRALRERAELSKKIAERLRKRLPKSQRAENYQEHAKELLTEANQIMALLHGHRAIDDTGDPGGPKQI